MMWPFGRKQLPTAMVDLHNHLAPDIDDGATSDQDTLEMLAQFQDLGYIRLAITSHLKHPLFPHIDAALIQQRVEHVKTLASAHEITIEILPGAEIYHGEDFFQQLENQELIPLGGDGPYYLIEFAPSDPMVYMKELGFQLGLKGLRPILAHPERYHTLQRKPSLYREWKRAGWLMQLDIASLSGAEGREVRKLAQTILRERGFSLAASDMHRPLRPENQYRKQLEQLRSEAGEEEAIRLLSTNPQRILDGKHTIEPDEDD